MSTLRDIIDTVNNLEGEVTDYISSTKQMKSLSKASQDGIMNFPVIVSDALTVEDAMIVSKALEKEFASFALIVMTMNPYLTVSGSSMSASDYIAKFHQNVDRRTDGTDIVNAIQKITNEAANLLDLDYEAANSLNQVLLYRVYENVRYSNVESANLKYNYTIDDVTESTILNDVVKRRINSIYKPITEARYKDEDFDNQMTINRLRMQSKQNQFNRQMGIDQFNHQKEQDEIRNAQANANYNLSLIKFDEDVRQHNISNNMAERNYQLNKNKFESDTKFRNDQFAYQKERDKISDAQYNDKLRIDRINANRNARQLQHLMDNDVKKANELVPTLLHMRIYPIDKKTGEELPSIDFVVGIKATLHPVPSDEMITNICRGVKNEDVLFNMLRWTTGEISFLKDFVFGINEIKIDAMNASHKSSKWWTMLKRRKAMAKIKNFVFPNKLLPNATIVVTQEEVNTIKEIYGYDLENLSIIDKLMSNYFLIAFVIVDPALQRVKFLFDGRTQFEMQTYATLARESTTNDKQFKEMLNMLGRRI